ncbi:hypothetical protein Q6277_06310, partial [Klebsiella quasipneumoniae]
RSRQAEEEGKDPDPRVEQALMVTIAFIKTDVPGLLEFAQCRLGGTQ